MNAGICFTPNKSRVSACVLQRSLNLHVTTRVMQCGLLLWTIRSTVYKNFYAVTLDHAVQFDWLVTRIALLEFVAHIDQEGPRPVAFVGKAISISRAMQGGELKCSAGEERQPIDAVKT